MTKTTEYCRAERWTLTVVGVLGLVGINGAFLYGLLEPELLRAALTNPVSLAFVVEALVLMVVLAHLLAKWGVARLSRTWFIVLSLVGSMAFALPAVLLWPRPGRTD